MPFVPGVGFLGWNFDDNATETGFYTIPPDPCGAAGLDRVIAVVNVGIECRDKTGTLIFRDALRDFFSPLAGQTLGTLTFDPKVVYDHYEGRFVVMTMEQTSVANGDPSDESRLLVAVSRTANPATATAADWWFLAINSKVNIGGFDHWADYPGFEVDEEAVYITANMFPFGAGSGGIRLWIIDKGVVGGFYAGGAAAVTVHNPIPAGMLNMIMMPALVFGAGGVGGPGSNIGTFLVGYSSATFGGPGANEAVQVIRVDDPLGATTFTGEFVVVGDLEDVGGIYGFPAIPDAPQSGTAALIDVGDSRTLDAVWRNNSLWFTATINPNAANDAVNQGSATAHWFRLDTSAVPSPITVSDQGNIGGEDIAANTWTFFPAVAVNANGDAKFGFSASAQTIFAGAYFAGREAADPPGTVQGSGVVQAGLDYYLRTFGLPRNRWGDYSGAAVDPADDTTFWVFNEYAETRGSPTSPPTEDGRWGTAWRSCAVVADELIDFGDAPDPYPTLLGMNGARHTIFTPAIMGATIDPEPDGQPTINADGDDINGVDDEDGVVFVTPLSPGGAAQVDVTVTLGGWLDIWFDWNQNGSWLDAGDQVYSGPVVAGVNPIPFVVPVGAFTGTTYSRFRYNLNGALPPDGPAPDGEVEDYIVLVEEALVMDFGDAPDQPYPTLLASNGARHVINPNVFMGLLIDSEPDGLPSPNADRDDLNNLDDEDGVVFTTPLAPGGPAKVDVTVSIDGWLEVWFDWDLNGSWLDPGEHVYSGPVLAGLNTIPFNVPAATPAGATVYSRFRFTQNGPLPPDGLAPDGEVEDYVSIVSEPVGIDWGDAPDPAYPTLSASGGASHIAFAGGHLGALIDAEPDGQPDPNALGDDLNNVADEDGVAFVTPLFVGQFAQVTVTASAAGWLDAWFDWNQNGSWLDAGDQIYSGPVVAGANPIGFLVPAAAFTGVTFTRFRYNLAGAALPPTGFGGEGEVEDYRAIVMEPPPDLDYGDAPDQPYPTLLASNGASHVVNPNAFMGALIDAEPDGLPDPNALGDDNNNLDDEDGVVLVTSLIQGQGAQANVTVTQDGWLDVFFDWNQNGSWLDPGELVYSGNVVAGVNPILFGVPAAANLGVTFSRYRYNIAGAALPPDGPGGDGEVEDYQVRVLAPPQELDFGDAPDQPYPTLLASNGARHIFDPAVFMGNQIDAEPDGLPNANATGDDINNLADEDGVTFITALVRGQAAQVSVLVSANGWLDVWYDWNQNGSWLDPGDQVYSGNVVAGANPIAFVVPAASILGQTFARYRYNAAGGALPPDGPGPEGEVEDYAVTVEPEEALDFGDAPDGPYRTLLVNDGARHVASPNMTLGFLIDAEPDGQPTPNADGDDNLGLPDEDGVTFTPLAPVNPSTVNVIASLPGLLDAWIDWDQDGVWTPAEQIFASQPLAAGANVLAFNVPGTGKPAFDTYARFRYSSVGGLQPFGLAPDGEVEDYLVHVEDDRVTGAGNAPSSFALYDAVPNPFNPQTTLSFALPTASHVTLMIFDVRGQLVRTLLDENRGEGVHGVVWDGRDDRGQLVASGVYLYRIQAGTFTDTKRMVLLK